MRSRRRRFRTNPIAVGILLAVVVLASSWRNTDFSSPPRFDGAGYAVLAKALASGRGYREIDHPDAPRHAHLPPGYPIALAGIWSLSGGPSARVAHGFSVACTCIATLVSWRWFRTMYSPKVAAWLGLGLAINWTWNRVGGSIQSEPLFLCLQSLVFLRLSSREKNAGVGRGILLGALLAAGTLTRQVGAALVVAAVIHLLLSGRWKVALVSLGTSIAFVLPWLVWLMSVRENTQAGLIGRGGSGLAALVKTQAVFYTQRLPDQLCGPFVEIGTVFMRSPAMAAVVNIWAILVSAVVFVGWWRTLRSPRRRLAGLSSFVTLGLLLVWPFTEAGRFLIPLVPCLLVGSVEGLVSVARPIVRQSRSRASMLVLAMSLPYSVYSLATNRAEIQRRTHADFDGACEWIAHHGNDPGSVLTRHPGEVYWQTGRLALAPSGLDAESIERDIEAGRVAYLLIDEERYVNAPENPLARFVSEHPERAPEVWSRTAGRSVVRVLRVDPERKLP